MSQVNSIDDAEALIQKLPCDMGIHRNPRKGTLDAPDKILEDLEFNEDVLIDEVFPDEFDLEHTHQRIHENTRELAGKDRPVLSVGGDHSVSFPVIKALKEENPGMKLVWLDSHLDVKEKVDGHVSHDVVVRELMDHGFSEDEIIFVGITRIDHDEEDFLKEHDFRIYRPDQVDEFMELDLEGDVYLSLDIDVLKKEFAPGTGYPDGELGLEEVENIIQKVGPVHADLVEVAPSLDINGRTIDSAQALVHTLLSELVFES
ncbi:hypothetical protein GKQ38_05385 [Candidatus Nanohaloarchaea archaeon]|nr:hypothetical protein GKQ38_05385 [Candidatus Nanohaloarchaea archaeon]